VKGFEGPGHAGRDEEVNPMSSWGMGVEKSVGISYDIDEQAYHSASTERQSDQFQGDRGVVHE
jgi:hypothetical protein